MLSDAAFYRNSFLMFSTIKAVRPRLKFRAHSPRALRMVRRSRASDATGGTGENPSGFHFPIDYL